MSTENDHDASPVAGDLFDYSAGLEDIHPENRPNTLPEQALAEPKEAGLGVDEEIRVTKTRRPVTKLDESRLLSQNGIPKLRAAGRKLKFKGKGHEFSDTMRLLACYQLWLDDLYPRARFSDGIAIIEKLGHSKRMQIMRKGWINEGRTNHAGLDSVRATNSTVPLSAPEDPNTSASNNVQVGESFGEQTSATLGSTLSTARDQTQGSGDENGHSKKVLHPEPEEPPMEEYDDLDALLAEQELEPSSTIARENNGKTSQPGPSKPTVEEYDDDLDALLREQDLY